MEAKDKNLGVFGSNTGEPMRIVDASVNAKKARTFLSFFKRAGRISAIVEHVISGSKLILYVPKDSCKLVFGLAGVKSPHLNRNDQTKSEPFAAQALEFAEKICLQREV